VKRKTPLTVADHLEIAAKLRQAGQLLRDVYDHIQPAYRKNSRADSAAWALVRSGCHVDRLRCVLDDDWHELITEAEFKQHGHIYYGGDK